jgi:hypothetical protein
MTSSINYAKKKISQNTPMHPPCPPENPKTQNPTNPKLRKRKRKNQSRDKNRYRTKEHNNSLVPQKQAAQIYRDFQHNSSALQTLDLRRRRSWKLVFRRNL